MLTITYICTKCGESTPCVLKTTDYEEHIRPTVCCSYMSEEEALIGEFLEAKWIEQSREGSPCE